MRRYSYLLGREINQSFGKVDRFLKEIGRKKVKEGRYQSTTEVTTKTLAKRGARSQAGVRIGNRRALKHVTVVIE